MKEAMTRKTRIHTRISALFFRAYENGRDPSQCHEGERRQLSTYLLKLLVSLENILCCFDHSLLHCFDVIGLLHNVLCKRLLQTRNLNHLCTDN